MRGALLNACFIGFTETPRELHDRNTRAVFGDYISIYDIQQAVDDGAAVPIYYGSRLAKLDLPEESKLRGGAEFEEGTEAEEVEREEKHNTSSWVDRQMGGPNGKTRRAARSGRSKRLRSERFGRCPQAGRACPFLVTRRMTQRGGTIPAVSWERLQEPACTAQSCSAFFSRASVRPSNVSRQQGGQGTCRQAIRGYSPSTWARAP